MSDQEIIDTYFNDPTIKELLLLELGPGGKITVDWTNRKITAVGSSASKEWDLNEMLKDLRGMIIQ